MSKFFKTITTVLPLGVALSLALPAAFTTNAYAEDEVAPAEVGTDTTTSIDMSEEQKPSDNDETRDYNAQPTDPVSGDDSELYLNPTDEVVEIEENTNEDPQIYYMNAAGSPIVQREDSNQHSSNSFELSNSHASNLMDWLKRKKKPNKL